VSIVIVVVLIVFGYLLFGGWGKAINNGLDGMVTITGNFSCLPLREPASTDVTECSLGIRSKDGSYYALNVSRVQDANIDLKAEDTIAVTGVVEPESEIPDSQWAEYNIRGVIKVNTLLRTR